MVSSLSDLDNAGFVILIDLADEKLTLLSNHNAPQ
jgi:hypothetical protein